MTHILRCTCTNRWQDRKYGPGMRVHNEQSKIPKQGEEGVTELTSPGIYPDIPDEAYHAISRASASRLKMLVAGQTLAHVKQDIDTPTEPTPALNFGHALHLAVLQPQTADTLIRVAPDVDGRTTAGKQAKAEFAASCGPGSIVLKQEEAEKLTAMVESIYAHPAARQLLEMPGLREASLLWDEPMLVDTTGEPEKISLPCKARLDFWPQAFGAIIDIKSTLDASPRSINRDMVNLGYYVQGAFYLRAAERVAQAGADILVPDKFLMIFVEKDPPYLVAVRNLIPEAILLGNQDLDYPLQQMARAYLTGQWPGYSDEIEDVVLPGWKMREEALYE